MADVSFLMPAVLGLGMLLWLVYGFVREDLAIIVANAVGSTLTAVLVMMKLRYDRNSDVPS